ncbi:Putative Rab-GTPase-TBC domain-containing protein [Septoria linicola]|uniref:GTPase-activating protein GYP5 n=1 Tax=Septoria linicola TaxID=215465 RepID=A0A9Q9EF63_9PEZI|nr:Putative Rab-GTPase-TBC domain-containing protein [Septoria linicola]
MASELRVKEDDDDNTSDKAADDHNDPNDNDAFEDATSTPRPASAEPDADAGAAAADEDKADGNIGGTEHAPSGGGLGISGVDGSTSSIEEERDQPPPPKISAPQLSPRDRSLSPSKQRSSRPGSPVKITHGLSGDVTLPTQPPPSTSERRQNLESRGSVDRLASPPPPHPGFARKASNGFGALLGRMGSIRKPARSPPASRQERFGLERRTTAASIASVDGNSTMASDSGKPSLQDQFSNLRRKEEFGTSETNGHTLHEQDEHTETQQTSANGAASPPTSPPKDDGRLRSPTNASLPPGTASGISAGPPPAPLEVNWDLWQQLVYEGPSAVTRTSGDEMNVAITAGIPPAIRGVVWQVLAESKNEELENVYRTLKARGTDAEQRPPNSRVGSTISVNGTSTDKDGTTSDASSEHSNHSTSANSGVASPPTSVDSHVPELQSKLLAEKQKRETAALQKLEKAIKRDMGSRTSYSKYTQSAGLQDGLFGVCKAYALFDEGVGYAQGINFIAMPLLFNMAEEEAFTLLVRLMSKYDLRSMFTPDMRGLHLRLYQFERLLEEHEPAVYCHLKRRNVEPQLYATQWFLTLFVYRFPLQLVLRIYDLILSEGLTAILKFGIVLIQHNRQALLEIKDMGQLTNFLKEKLFDVYIDKSPSASSLLDSGFFGSVTGGADKELYRADDMVRDACTIKISDDTLKAYSVEWEEIERVKRERETELENLRLANASLQFRIKNLEERAQQHDTEHVTIAQDLVKIKVENDSLQDANEGLKVQVEELKSMVDRQPEEVESRLKEEMDRIMQRNIEVQNENRNLKEEMDEMEHELVNAKMAHAQAQADHDTLKKRLTSVQSMLSEKQ